MAGPAAAAAAGTLEGDRTVPPPATLADAAALRSRWLGLLGPFPDTAPALDAEFRERAPIQGIDCRHVRFRCEEDDWITAYLLVPESAREGASPAVICPHSTTGGAGKNCTAGVTGKTPGSPPGGPMESRAYGLELARWGYITLCIDLWGDGERIPAGSQHYDSTAFYKQHPQWSMVGKNIWDVMRSVDFLRTVDAVDPTRIACMGHSLGGHTTLFAAAFDDRIAAAVSNGGQLSWVRDTSHWSRPPDPQGRPVSSYVYLPGFRPYLEDRRLPVPVDFESLMVLTAPRPLLVMGTESEFARDDIIGQYVAAHDAYRQHNAGDRFTLFDYPGEHAFPPVAKRHAFNWLDRWFAHTPAVPTIWPGVSI